MKRHVVIGAATASIFAFLTSPARASGTLDASGTSGYGSVSLLPAGALLTVGTERSGPVPAGVGAAEGQRGAVDGGAPEPVAASPAQATGSGPAAGGPAGGAGNGCLLTLSDLPQTQPGGAYYDVACPAADGNLPSGLQSQGTVWVPNRPGGAGGRAAAPVPLPPPAAVLAREAADQLLLPAPHLEMSPAADRDQVVGFPTWLWVGPGSFTPRTRTVAVPGESVTARAVPVSTSWVLGDGSTLTCAGAGTPYTPGGTPAAASPDCGHTYLEPSLGQPGGRYPVTVTTRWQISWAGAGQAGVLPELSRTAAGSLRVAEVQTLNS